MQVRSKLRLAIERSRVFAGWRAVALAAVLAAGASVRLGAQPVLTQPANDTTGSKDFRLGLYGAYELTQHDLTLGTIPGVVTCSPGFTNTSGSGSAFGALAQYAFSDKISGQMRLGYSSSSAKFSTMEDIGNAVANGEVVSAISEHTIDLQLGMIDIEPRVMFTPFSFPLAIGVGLQASFIQTATYEQKETLISPTNATFAGGHTVRNDTKGDVPRVAAMYLAGLGALSYDIPLSRRVTLAPEISYHRGLSRIIQDSTWKMHEIRFGAALKFRFGVPDLPEPPVTVPPVAGLAATVNASALLEGSVEQPIAQMKVEEFLSSQLRPLLNYVFFDEGSAEIPARYARLTPERAANFGLANLHNMDQLPTYYQILNVIGRRMQDNPDASLSITGCNSGEGTEKGMADLSRNRAEAVRNYLRDAWGIPESRMKVDARDLPQNPSNISDPDGIVENRRVEIQSSTPAILEPVFTTDTVRTTNPPSVRFHTEARAEAGLRNWKLSASQGGRTLREFSGNGDVPPTIDWSVEREQNSIPRGTGPINYQLNITDATGRTYTTPVGSLAIDQVTVQRKRQEKIADKETNRYSLILFDFGKSDISDANRKIVSFIKQRITPQAKVAVTGYTDRLGDEDYNQKLSEDRAKATARALGVTNADVNGVGESILLYDNTLPEGRFYCRVVNVVVETPVTE